MSVNFVEHINLQVSKKDSLEGNDVCMAKKNALHLSSSSSSSFIGGSFTGGRSCLMFNLLMKFFDSSNVSSN